jgi:hypothetical protein
LIKLGTVANYIHTAIALGVSVGVIVLLLIAINKVKA